MFFHVVFCWFMLINVHDWSRIVNDKEAVRMKIAQHSEINICRKENQQKRNWKSWKTKSGIYLKQGKSFQSGARVQNIDF
jgi:hypothetical protein